MKATYDRNLMIPKISGKIVGLQDQVARAFDGTKYRNSLGLQDFDISKGENSGRCIFPKVIWKALRIKLIFWPKSNNLVFN